MRTLTAQRLKKQAEQEYKNRGEMIDRPFEEARAEAKRLEDLLNAPVEMIIEETFRAWKSVGKMTKIATLSKASLNGNGQINQIGYQAPRGASG